VPLTDCITSPTSRGELSAALPGTSCVRTEHTRAGQRKSERGQDAGKKVWSARAAGCAASGNACRLRVDAGASPTRLAALCTKRGSGGRWLSQGHYNLGDDVLAGEELADFDADADTRRRSLRLRGGGGPRRHPRNSQRAAAFPARRRGAAVWTWSQ